LNIIKDVTEVIKEKLKEQDYKKFYFNVDNNVMREDPCPNNRKFLFVEFYLNNDKNIHKLGAHEGMFLDQSF
jgi:hypothetical protein